MLTRLWPALRRYAKAQIAEIRSDKALRLYGACLAIGHVLCYRAWSSRSVAQLLSNEGEAICWPFFERCFEYRFFGPAQVSLILLLYAAASVMGALLFFSRKRCGLAWGWLLLVNLFKTLIYVQDYRLRMNQHYMLYVITLAFLFLPNKRQLLRYTLVAFYVWASTLKYNSEWLSGSALHQPPLGIPARFVPASCAYVILLESFLVWGVLSSRRWVYWAALMQLILFHIVSWPVVGAFYPLLMFALLMIFPLAVQYPQPREPKSLLHALFTGGQPRSTYAFLAAFSLLQLVPVMMPGDERLTGEGRLFSLHMIDSRVFCQGAITLKFKDGATQALPIPMTGASRVRRGTTRIRCEPAVHFSRATRACDEHRDDPNFLDLDLAYEARRSTEQAMRPLVAVKDFCRQDLSYDLWRPNAWILKSTEPEGEWFYRR